MLITSVWFGSRHTPGSSAAYSSASILCVILVCTSILRRPTVRDWSSCLTISTYLQFAVQKNSLTFLGLVETQAKRMSFRTRILLAPAPLPAHNSTCCSPFPDTVYSNSFLGSLNARGHIRSKSVRTFSSSAASNFRVGTARVPMVSISPSLRPYALAAFYLFCLMCHGMLIVVAFY